MDFSRRNSAFLANFRYFLTTRWPALSRTKLRAPFVFLLGGVRNSSTGLSLSHKFDVNPVEVVELIPAPPLVEVSSILGRRLDRLFSWKKQKKVDLNLENQQFYRLRQFGALPKFET